jgi:hypothetical protein
VWRSGLDESGSRQEPVTTRCFQVWYNAGNVLANWCFVRNSIRSLTSASYKAGVRAK